MSQAVTADYWGKLTIRDILVLKRLALGEARFTDLMSELGLSAGTVSSILNRLRAIDLVARSGDGYAATELGRRVLEDVRRSICGW